MRKGLSLIELIFTIVIIALVFTVIPKVVLSLNKSDSFAIRQDGLFAGTSFLSMASKLPWDEQNVNEADLLQVSSGDSRFDCNTTTNYRIGSFIGSRNCEQNLPASDSLRFDYGEGSDYFLYDDIDDFNGKSIDINSTTNKLYELNTSVNYMAATFTYNYTNASVTIDLNASADINTSSNLKRFNIVVNYAGRRGSRRISQFNYVSSNIGQMILNKRDWQ